MTSYFLDFEGVFAVHNEICYDMNTCILILLSRMENVCGRMA